MPKTADTARNVRKAAPRTTQPGIDFLLQFRDSLGGAASGLSTVHFLMPRKPDPFKAAETELDKVVVALERLLPLLTPETWKDVPKADLFHTVPHPTDRFSTLLIGQQGQAAFRRLVDLFFRAFPQLDGRIRPDEIIAVLKRAFTVVVLRINQPSGLKTARFVMTLTYRYVKRFRLETATHYLACSLVDSNENQPFVFGGCHFIPTRLFLLTMRESIDSEKRRFEQNMVEGERRKLRERRATERREPAEKWPRLHLRHLAATQIDRVVDRYQNCSWVVGVTVKDSTSSAATQRAMTAARLAINAMRLIEPFLIGKHFGLFDPPRAGQTAHIWTTPPDQAISWQLNLTTYPISIEDELWREQFSGDLFVALSHAIEPIMQRIAEGSPLPATSQRIVDALTWFGEALEETEASHSVIARCAVSLETILTTKSDGIRKQIVERGACLAPWADEITEARERYWQDQIERFYTCRGDIIHANVKLDPVRLRAIARLGLEMLARILTNSIFWFNHIEKECPEMSVGKLQYYYAKRLRQDVGLSK